MELKVLTSQNVHAGAIAIDNSVFSAEFNSPLVHQVVTAGLAARRSGTSTQKTRAQVRGGGRKPWRQKGTGRARAGTVRSPIWRGGGVTFAASGRDFSQKVNRKMYRGAMRAILSELLRQQRLLCVESLALEEVKTRIAVATLRCLGIAAQDRLLIVADTTDENLALAVRNLPDVDIALPRMLTPVLLLQLDKLLCTRVALEQIEKALQ